MTAAEELRAEGIEIGRAVKQRIADCKDLTRWDTAHDLFLDADSVQDILRPLD
jgi:hypothetical protein